MASGQLNLPESSAGVHVSLRTACMSRSLLAWPQCLAALLGVRPVTRLCHSSAVLLGSLPGVTLGPPRGLQ